MAKLSDAQIAGAAKAGGFTGSAIAKAVAVALAESGGNPNAHNNTGPDNSYGLWQINMLGSLGPARRKQFNISSNSDLFDPTTNAKAAYAISNGGKNWRPWSVYTSGKYLVYMSRGNKAAGNPDSSGIVQAGLGVSDTTAAIGEFFDFIASPINWLRLGMMVGGGILVAVALIQISGATGQAKKLASIMPTGRIAKAVTA